MRLPRSPRAALTFLAILFAVIWGAFLGFLQIDGRGSVLDRIESVSLDLRFLLGGKRPAPRDLLIVAIDDATVAQAGGYPLPRTAVASLVRTLAALAPKALALDLLLLDPGPLGADQGLAASLRLVPAVLGAAALFTDDGPRSERGSLGRSLARTPEAARVLLPISPLREAAPVGLVNVVTDHGGTPRHVPMIFRHGEQVLPSFALLAAARSLGVEPELGEGELRLGDRSVPLDLGAHLALRFYGPRGHFETISAARVLRGELAAEQVRDRVVVIGATALGSGDTFPTPFDPNVPGVEVLTTAIANLLNGDALARTPRIRAFDAAATVLLPALSVGLLALRRITLGIALATALALGWCAVAIAAFLQGTWLSLAHPLAALLPVVTAYAAGRLWLDAREERRLTTTQRALQRFHAPAFAERLVADPEYLSTPVQQDAAILFVDLTGFTGLSEQLGPEATGEFLKSFHLRVERVAAEHGGVVVNFMGDGAMLAFGLPDRRPDDARRALGAAEALQRAVSAWLAVLPRAMGGSLAVRVGAHAGPVVVSRMGGDRHQQITATGDTVNVASRLLEVASRQGADIVLSCDLIEAAGVAASPLLEPFEPPVEIPIRGRSQVLRVRLRRAPLLGGER